MKRYKVLATLMCYVSIVMITVSISLGVGACGNETSSLTCATLAWDDPNPSELEVIGYRLYYGTQSRLYNAFIETQELECTVHNLTVGVLYYFTVTAFNTVAESDYSNELVWRGK